MSERNDADVLIVGGGPVGLTLRGDRPPDDPLALIDRVRGALAGEAVLQRAQAPTFALDPSSRLSAAQPVT
jgi:hypothetical protein